jgi:hypothetical protein
MAFICLDMHNGKGRGVPMVRYRSSKVGVVVLCSHPLVEFDLWVAIDLYTRFADVLFPQAEIVVDVQLLYQFVQNGDAWCREYGVIFEFFFLRSGVVKSMIQMPHQGDFDECIFQTPPW